MSELLKSLEVDLVHILEVKRAIIPKKVIFKATVTDEGQLVVNDNLTRFPGTFTLEINQPSDRIRFTGVANDGEEWHFIGCNGCKWHITGLEIREKVLSLEGLRLLALEGQLSNCPQKKKVILEEIIEQQVIYVRDLRSSKFWCAK